MSDADTYERQQYYGPAKDPAKAGMRRKLLLSVGGAVLMLALLWWVWSTFFTARTETTDNAYTNVELAQITPLVGGAVTSLNVRNTQPVHAGQVLLQIDRTDMQLAVDEAQAALGRARRQVEQVLANDANLAGQVGVRAADVDSAKADLLRAQADLDRATLNERRRAVLAGPGAISAQEYSDSQTITRQARAGVAQAQARVLVQNVDVEHHPDVLAAKARLNQARIDLDRTTIRAPIDGVIDQRKVAIGQRVQPGVPLMVVVPVQNMYVDANFKEGQLRGVQPGQRVRVTSDLYGSKIVYHGNVEGFAGGSGAAFAAIPAQNATGNWIKVVQRLPVRIRLDPADLRQHPLRVGLSMHATVDLSDAKRDGQ
jgi:membrane fusion protein (multidrug efflux system)